MAIKGFTIVLYFSGNLIYAMRYLNSTQRDNDFHAICERILNAKPQDSLLMHVDDLLIDLRKISFMKKEEQDAQ